MKVSDFFKTTDHDGNPCVQEYGTPYKYTPGDHGGHQWDNARGCRISAPRYDCCTLSANEAYDEWVRAAREACEFYGIA